MVLKNPYEGVTVVSDHQGGFDGRGQQTASPMLTAIMSGGVGISGRDLYKLDKFTIWQIFEFCRVQLTYDANHLNIHGNEK